MDTMAAVVATGRSIGELVSKGQCGNSGIYTLSDN